MPGRTYTASAGYRFGYNKGSEKDDEISGAGNHFTTFYREGDVRLVTWWGTDPKEQEQPYQSPYSFMDENPIIHNDPVGNSVDADKVMASPNHAKAFSIFAQTKEGKTFLKDYASKGQKIEYKGKTIFQATEAGKYDKKGVNLIYGINTAETVSETYTEKNTPNHYDIHIDIATNPKGTENKIFNLVEHITHESFMHAPSQTQDHLDDGSDNNSNLPKAYQKYGTHADHYFISREYYANPNNKDVQLFAVSGLSVLRQANTILGLHYSDTKIKTAQWGFSGSLIKVNQKSGILEYKRK